MSKDEDGYEREWKKDVHVDPLPNYLITIFAIAGMVLVMVAMLVLR